jgi:hypothetical protein
MSRDDLAAIELTGDEQHLLVWGLQVWHGASHPSLAMRHALGFEDYADIFPWTSEKVRKIGPLVEFTRADWTQLMLLVELGFASDNMGAGLKWIAISGIPDDQTIRLLRSVQRKLRSALIRYDSRTGEPIPDRE